MKNLLYFIFYIALLVPFNSFSQGCEEPESSDGDSEKSIKIIGFIQPQYEYHFTEDEDNFIENSNTFKFKRARIGVTGQIPYDFSYYVLVETSPFVSASGYPYLIDAFVSYRRFEWAKFSMGSFKQPFGLEVNTSCSGLHTIERSKASDQFVSPQRDYGFMVFGGTKESLLRYSVAIMNGSGLGHKDNNNKKDLSGRVVFHPLDFLNVGVSARYGFPRKDTTNRTSFAGDIEVKYSNFMFQAEYIFDKGDYDPGSGGGCGGPAVILGDKRNGWYAMAMYRTYFDLEPIIKFESFIQDVDADNEYKEYIATIGVNYFFNDKTRLQANYRYAMEKNKDATAEIPNDAILLQLQIKF